MGVGGAVKGNAGAEAGGEGKGKQDKRTRGEGERRAGREMGKNGWEEKGGEGKSGREVRKRRGRLIENRHESTQRGIASQLRQKLRSLRAFEQTEDVERSLFFELLVHEGTFPSTSRKASKPRRIRAFTVPRGVPSFSEIWVWVSPAKNARSIASRCAAPS